MHSLWEVVVIATLAGVLGTGGGGLLMAFVPQTSNRTLGAFLGFSGGVMLAVSFLDLIPEAFGTGRVGSAVIGIITGMALILILEHILPHAHYDSAHEEQAAHLKRVGILIGIGIAMHNIPEGFAIGAGFSAEVGLGWGLALVMGIHNLPEGLAMATMLKGPKTSASTLVLATSLAGLPMGIGAIGGYILGDVSPAGLAWALGLAAGAMLYITFSELLPDAYTFGERSPTTWGLILGVLLALGMTLSL